MANFERPYIASSDGMVPPVAGLYNERKEAMSEFRTNIEKLYNTERHFEAIDLARKEARKCNYEAFYELYVMYRNGIGDLENAPQAMAWLALAKESGLKIAIEEWNIESEDWWMKRHEKYTPVFLYMRRRIKLNKYKDLDFDKFRYQFFMRKWYRLDNLLAYHIKSILEKSPTINLVSRI